MPTRMEVQTSAAAATWPELASAMHIDELRRPTAEELAGLLLDASRRRDRVLWGWVAWMCAIGLGLLAAGLGGPNLMWPMLAVPVFIGAVGGSSLAYLTLTSLTRAARAAGYSAAEAREIKRSRRAELAALREQRRRRSISVQAEWMAAHMASGDGRGPQHPGRPLPGEQPAA